MKAWSAFKIFIGFLITLFVVGGTTLYLVGFCTVWSEWTYTVLFSWVISILVDLLVLETVTEGLITLFYVKKDESELCK